MIPADELAALQAVVADANDMTATIVRPTLTQDAYGFAGGATSAVTTTSVSVRSPSASVMNQYAALLGTVRLYMLRFPSGTDVRENDIVTISGVSYRANIIFTPESFSAATRVLASLLS